MVIESAPDFEPDLRSIRFPYPYRFYIRGISRSGWNGRLIG